MDLPDFLTVPEAAAVLRIGRTAAYDLAKRYERTDGAEGLPVVRIGRVLRVPRAHLERLAGTTITRIPPALPAHRAEAVEPVQLSLPSTAA